MKIKSARFRMLSVNGIGIVIIYAVVFLLLGVACPNFLTLSNIMINIRQSVFICLCGFAMTFVISMGGIDLSVGSIAGISAMLVAIFISKGMNIYLAILVVVLIGGGIGAVNGLLVTKLHIAYFLATLGVSEVLRGLIYVYTKGVPIYGLRYKEFTWFGQGYISVVPVPIIITLLLLGLSCYLFYKTKMGRYAVSIGSNAEAAKLVGIHVDRVKILVMSYAGALCAIAGIILCARNEAAIPEAGSSYVNDSIAATVIAGTSMSGGKGNMVGTVFGAILMSTISSGMSMLNISSYWHQVVIGGFILFAVAFDYFATRSAEKN